MLLIQSNRPSLKRNAPALNADHACTCSGAFLPPLHLVHLLLEAILILTTTACMHVCVCVCVCVCV